MRITAIISSLSLFSNVNINTRDIIRLLSIFLFYQIILCFLPQNTFSETEVSGEVSGTWNLEGSPYIVTGDLLIPVDNTLFIQPGVTVEFPNQNENRFVFNVHGTLEALGTEEDSIYFLSQDSTFRGFSAEDDFEGMRLHLEYCVVDSTDSLINVEYSSSVVLRHSRLHFNRKGMLTRESADTVQSCEFIYTGENEHGRIASRFGGPHVFTENTGDINWDVGWAEICPVFGNDISKVVIAGIPGLLEVYDNEIDVQFWADEALCDVHDNTIGGIHFIGTNSWIENNDLRSIWIQNCEWAEIHDNTIVDTDPDGVIHIFDTECNITRNLIVGPGDGIVGSFNDPPVNLFNNTIVFSEDGVKLHESSEIFNNIFIGAGEVSTGIVTWGDISATTHYNLFFDILELVRNGGDLNETNFTANPQFCGGDPFDYHLQANSPCIDAGDPESPDDPDGTRADIGCYYYDQSIDNPPVLTSPNYLYGTSMGNFSYTARATDDNGPLTFHFEGIPDHWEIDPDDLDWVADSAVVEGMLPDDEGILSFGVWVEDELGQTDTSEVFVEVRDYTILQGEINGILPVELSPYYVVHDLVVPEGDSLVIEPGCELLFRYVEDANQRLRLTCYGTLIAEGTEEDSIWFTMADDEAVIRGWKYLLIQGEQATASFKHVEVNYGAIAIYVDSFALAIIKKCLFPPTQYTNAIAITSQAEATIDSCLFFGIDHRPATMVTIGNETVANITNNIFEDYEIYPQSYAMGLSGEHSFVHGNTILGTRGINVNWGGNAQLTRNVFYCTIERWEISVANYSRFDIFNNLFIGYSRDTTTVVATASLSDSIVNNVFYNFNEGLFLRDWEEDFESSPVIRNNVFIACSTGIQSELNPNREYQTEYNIFWDVDEPTIGVPLDSTNIVCDPGFADTLYHLYDSSPLINAGHPDQYYNDIDGTRNDIGLWGGPYGESYEYPLWVQETPHELPSTLNVFSPYPNPFNSTQSIHVALPQRSVLFLKIYNVMGQIVYQRQYPVVEAGYHKLTYHANEFSSGMYFLEIHAGKEVRRVRVVLVK